MLLGGLCAVAHCTTILYVRWRKKGLVGEYMWSVVRFRTLDLHRALWFWLFAYALERRRFRLIVSFRCARLGGRAGDVENRRKVCVLELRFAFGYVPGGLEKCVFKMFSHPPR